MKIVLGQRESCQNCRPSRSIQVAILGISISEIKRTGLWRRVFSPVYFNSAEMAQPEFFRPFDVTDPSFLFQLVRFIADFGPLLSRCASPSRKFQNWPQRRNNSPKIHLHRRTSTYVRIVHRMKQSFICHPSLVRRRASERKIDRFPSRAPVKKLCFISRLAVDIFDKNECTAVILSSRVESIWRAICSSVSKMFHARTRRAGRP